MKGDEIAWNNPWHFHPEVELLYCIKGRGTNFVGDTICSIEEGEILLFGSNLPHTRQRDKEFYLQHPSEVPQTIVIQFKEDFLGENFFKVQEFVHVKDLLNRALRGMKFFGESKDKVAQMLTALSQENCTQRLLRLLEILHTLALSEEVNYLNYDGYKSDAHEKSSQKINKVYEYTINHFREEITLTAIADLVNMAEAAFCRYFKARTRKSYFQYLTEVRVGYACKLLSDSELDISGVCYASGFNNLSHFHKQFKKITRMTPKTYQEKSIIKR
jgi:YesN/AraC family two-component response regulator